MATTRKDVRIASGTPPSGPREQLCSSSCVIGVYLEMKIALESMGKYAAVWCANARQRGSVAAQARRRLMESVPPVLSFSRAMRALYHCFIYLESCYGDNTPQAALQRQERVILSGWFLLCRRSRVRCAALFVACIRILWFICQDSSVDHAHSAGSPLDFPMLTIHPRSLPRSVYPRRGRVRQADHGRSPCRPAAD